MSAYRQVKRRREWFHGARSTDLAATAEDYLQAVIEIVTSWR